LARRIVCFSRLICAVISIGIATVSASMVQADDADILAIVERAARIKRGAVSVEPPNSRSMRNPMSEPEGSTTSRRVKILVSWSLGAAALRDVLRDAAGRDDVEVVFRGVAVDETFGQGIRRIHALLRDVDPLPHVVIDPTVFSRLSTTTVPIAAAFEGERVVAWASGIVSPGFLDAEIAKGKTGDLGVVGPTAVASEPDLIEVLKARATNFDLNAYKRRAIEEYWSHVRFETLPPTTERRERIVDPTVVVTRAITDANDVPLVAAGTRINPLDKMPFRQRLVVFDASSPGQVETALNMSTSAGDRRVTLMITALGDGGWKELDRVESRLSSPVYLLTPDVAQRFKIERVPSMIEARDRVFVVTEIPPAKGESR